MRRVLRDGWIFVVCVALLPMAPVDAATGVSTTRVTVRDDGVDPAEACVRKGGKVMWTSAGERAHRITADQRTWAAFTLAPGKSKSITFPRIGRHPYRVDGAPVGFVDVRTTCPATGGPSGGGTGTGTVLGQPGTRFVTYDVEVRGTLIQKGKSFNGGLLAYELDRTLAWSGTYPRVRVELLELPTGVWSASLGRDLFVQSTERFTVQSRALSQSISNPPPPPVICSAAVSLVLPTKLYVAGGGGNVGVDGFLTIAAGLTDEGSKALEAAEEAQYAGSECTVHTDSAGPPFDIANGMKAQLYLGGFTPTFTRSAGLSKAPPADALLRGAEFQITAGPRTTTDSCFGDVCSEEERYEMIFRPAR